MSVEAVRRYMASLPPAAGPWREELADRRLWKAVRTELVGTLLLTVAGCGPSLRWHLPDPEDPAGEPRAAAAAGLAAVALGRWTGPVSGGHLNPAVTAGLAAAGKLSAPRAALYVAAQCLGGLAAAAVLYGLAPPAERAAAGLAVPRPPRGVPSSQAFGAEFLGSLVVVLSALAAGGSAVRRPGLEPHLAIGLAYGLGHLLAWCRERSTWNCADWGRIVFSDESRFYCVLTTVANVSGDVLGSVWILALLSNTT
ncbi:hypothetical protein LAZ67_19001394 [Cordylochernes scorpioides]|uniref:Uncharacterized protein n=1 Tax=Cordylochernes scorpioides TaxID=51811 RepID=A0ABY6LKG2_9ARAC|nr:hypothetical protein LAZ67_19001394 [Cordylochernes scorpioides]